MTTTSAIRVLGLVASASARARPSGVLSVLAWVGGIAALVTIVTGLTKLASFVKRRSARAVHVDFEHHAKAALRVIDLNDYLSGRPEPPPALLHYALAVRLANKGDVSELVDRLWLANAAGTQREAVRMSDREIPARKWLTVPVDRDRFGDLDGGFVAVAELAGHPREIRSDVEHLRDDIVQEVLESRVANGY